MDLLHQLTANHAPGPHYEPAGADDLTAESLPVRVIAYYLPQFHPIPENDAWWGAGFTEWTNVTRALPRYRGHYQPHLPADMGFYDLRLPEVLARQARLARAHGVHGFCFYHYWFAGRRVLERPVETLLAHPEIDLPFCLCWANENWTRTWDGGSAHTLLEQGHSPENDVGLIESMIPALRDPRYIRVGGRPIVLVYRPGLLPDMLATTRRWRERLVAAGVGDPLLVMTKTFELVDPATDPRALGFDAAAEFPPHDTPIGQRKPVFLFDPDFKGQVLEYDDVVTRFMAAPDVDYPVFRAVMPGWDNEARRPNRGRTFRGSTPAKYERWLTAVCRRAMREHAPESRIAFVNAWNEWAEGAHLEPDRHFGHAYLRATGRALQAARAAADPKVGGADDDSLRARIARVKLQQQAHLHNALLRLQRRRAARRGPQGPTYAPPG